jgi:hypothetical protein
MKLNWRWFLGGQKMFWMGIILFIVLVVAFTFTYIVDPTERVYMRKENVDENSIKFISESYINSRNITIDKPIEYRFVHYFCNENKSENDEVLLGTFHEWNGTYYINISVDLYNAPALIRTVIHETRHMLVEYLKDQKIIDLTDYTEEIAEGSNEQCNNMFTCGINLLRSSQKK